MGQAGLGPVLNARRVPPGCACWWSMMSSRRATLNATAEVLRAALVEDGAATRAQRGRPAQPVFAVYVGWYGYQVLMDVSISARHEHHATGR